MTHLDEVTRHLDALKGCPVPDIATHLSPALGHALLFQAMDRFISEEHRSSLLLLTQARAIFAAHDDRDGLGLCAMLTGAIYRTFGNYDLALKVLWEGQELLRASGQFPIFLAANANSLANIQFDRGHLDEALALFNVTLEESTRGLTTRPRRCSWGAHAGRATPAPAAAFELADQVRDLPVPVGEARRRRVAERAHAGDRGRVEGEAQDRPGARAAVGGVRAPARPAEQPRALQAVSRAARRGGARGQRAEPRCDCWPATTTSCCWG